MFISASVYMCNLFNKKNFCNTFWRVSAVFYSSIFFNQQSKQILLIIILFLPIDLGHAYNVAMKDPATFFFYMYSRKMSLTQVL